MAFPGNWSQQAADNLTRLARHSVRQAVRSPGQWVNPTPLHTGVRYNAEEGLFELGEGEVSRFRVAGEEDAVKALRDEWGHELYQSGNEVATVVDLVDRLTGPLAAMLDAAEGRWFPSYLRYQLHQRCFIKAAETVGFMRWYSADRRFPASVWIPASGRPSNPLSSQDLLIAASGYRYDFNNPKDLLLEVFGYFSLSRFDLDTAGYGSDIWGFIEQEVNHLRATKGIMAEHGLGWFKAIDRLQMKGAVVGEGKEALRAPRLHLRDEHGREVGEWVFFPGPPNQGNTCWLFSRGSECSDERAWLAILASFRWLDEWFFDKLAEEFPGFSFLRES
jgi:hypothetical protein